MQLTEKDLYAQMGKYMSDIEKFIDLMVHIFFKHITGGSTLADEIVRLIRNANSLRDFFRRAAKNKLKPADYEIFCKHMNIAKELFEFRNQLAHGTVISLAEIEDMKQKVGKGGTKIMADGASKMVDMVAEQLAKEPLCSCGVIPPFRVGFYKDPETFNDRFYCHSITDVTRNLVRLKALHDVMQVGWAKYDLPFDLAKLEEFLEESGKPEFVDLIRKRAGEFYGPQSYT